MPSPCTSTFPLKELLIENTTVFYEDSFENLLLYFSKEEAKNFVHLLHEAQLHPKKIYADVLAKKELYPNNPMLDNLLTFLYFQNKEMKKAEELIVDGYHQYPEYFFAKINYADQCLRLKKWDQIPLIFPSFDLTTLFPDKTKFHVSEFRGFMIVVCRYFLCIKQKDQAKLFYQKALLADPSHPSLISLEKELFSFNCFKKWFCRLKYIYREFLTKKHHAHPKKQPK